MKFKTYIALIAVPLAVILIVAGAVADTRSYWRGTDEIGNQMTYYDDVFSPTAGTSIWETCPLLAGMNPGTAYSLTWEFAEGTVDSTLIWQFTADVGTHTKAVADTSSGILLLEAKTTDNNEIYMYGRGEPIRFRADKPVWFEALVRPLAVTDSTYADGVIVGIVSAGGANTLQDNGAGPPANYSGAVFYIADLPQAGSTYWNCETSSATTQETTASAAARTAGTWVRLGIVWDGNDAVYFYKDGTLVATHTTTYPADSVSMTPLVGVKTGAAATTSLEVDYIKIVGVR